ncbi:hypothetical protein Trydic_g1103 [Trypoxylus dichotomus]
MGCSISASDKVEPVEEENRPNPYGALSTPQSRYKPSKSRQCTDVFFLILMASFFLVLGLFLGYCIVHGNIYRVINGYDNCANVCGIQNYRITGDPRFECVGRDRKNERFLLVKNLDYFGDSNEHVQRICVKNCSEYGDYRQVFNRCLPKKAVSAADSFISKLGWHDFFQEAGEDLLLTWREILYLCLIGFAFSVILVILLRFFVGILVWVVLVGVILFSVAATIAFWYLYYQHNDNEDAETSYLGITIAQRQKSFYLICGILATIVSFCVIVVIIALRKRINLVVQLFVEAGKSITAMPLLLFEPLLTLISLFTVIVCWLYFSLWIQSAGFLTYVRKGFFIFKSDSTMKIAGFWNLFSMLWMCQFIIGCQHMVLGGAIATWYFTRNKNQLGYPIIYSFYNLIRYHLGSVCFGSLIIAIVQLVRILLLILQRYLKNKTGRCAQCILTCCQCCLYCFEKSLKFISGYAYIRVAMYGKNFCKSGREAFKVLVNNSLRVTVINSVGDFVLILTKVLVVVATVIIGVHMLQNKEGLQYMWIPLVLVGTFTYFVAHCFITVYEMAIDTIFLCFCEDCEQNDGILRPYFMSKSLMKFVENSRKAMYAGNEGQSPNVDPNCPRRRQRRHRPPGKERRRSVGNAFACLKLSDRWNFLPYGPSYASIINCATALSIAKTEPSLKFTEQYYRLSAHILRLYSQTP